MKFRNPSFWAPVASSALLLLAFPPADLGLLVFAALAPWFRSLRDEKHPFRSGYLFGIIFSLGQLHWIDVLTAKFTGSAALGLVPWLLASVLMALYFGLFGWLASRCCKRGCPWLIPFVWAGIEVFRSYIPIFAFPWGLLAVPLWPYPAVLQGAHFGTIYLVSAWIAAANLVLAQVLCDEPYRKWRTGLAAFLLILVGSFVWSNTSYAGANKVVTIGQPAVDMAFGDPRTEDQRLESAVEYLIAVARMQRADVLVLPEGVVRASDGESPRTRFKVDPEVPMLVGGQRGTNPAYQSAFAYDGKWTHADKTRLVIFGEFVPGRDFLPFLRAFRLPSGDLTAGSELKPLKVRDIPFGQLVCFEGLFPDLAYRQAMSGSKVLAVMSNDDWFLNTPAADQLRAASTFRAIETGLPLVRSASNGYSEAVDARGAIVAQAPLYQRRGLRAEVSLPAERQTFPLLPLFPFICVASLFAPAFLRGEKQAKPADR